MFNFTKICFSGSRDLSAAYRPFVQERVQAFMAEGARISVGCAAGADAYVELTCPNAIVFRARAFAFGQSWVDALKARSRASVRSVLNGGAVVAFFAKSQSWGTYGTCRFALTLDIPVFAFPCGFGGSMLPKLGPGRWLRVSSGILEGAYLWVPHKSNIRKEVIPQTLNDFLPAR